MNINRLVILLLPILMIFCHNNKDLINALAIIQTVNGKSPEMYYVNNDETSLIYIEFIPNENSGGESILLKRLDRFGETWAQLNSFSIVEESGTLLLLDSVINEITIEGRKYLFFRTECAYAGTWSIGYNKNRFIYYDMVDDKLLDVAYSIRSREVIGNYEYEDSDVSRRKAILNHATKEVNKIYGDQNTDLDSEENFHLKWLSVNNNIYKQSSEERGEWIKVNFIEMDKSFFYKRIEDDPNNQQIISNSKYIAYAGFVNPILAYSKKSGKSFVLWIPEGWPNGGAWGIRSFKIDNIDNNIIIASNEGTTIYFDMINSLIRAVDN